MIRNNAQRVENSSASSFIASISTSMALVWERISHDCTTESNFPYVQVSLQPVVMETTYSDCTSKESGISSTLCTAEDEMTSLQIQRELRKSQHEQKAGALPQFEHLAIVYHDDHLVVVNKPSGILSSPGLNSRISILDLVIQRFGTLPDMIPDRMIVHRLDMDTSGLIVFGRTATATRKLHAAFRDKKVRKEYESLVVGNLSYDEVRIDLPIQRDHEHSPFRRVPTPSSEEAAHSYLKNLHNQGLKKEWKLQSPKPSQTHIKVIERVTEPLPCTRLRMEPITGRTHQLRIHCAAIGFPIIGDPTYGLYGEAAPMGGVESLSTYRKEPGGSLVLMERSSTLELQKAWMKEHPPNEKPMCLHARMLELEHPVTGQTIKWEVPAPF